MSEPLDPTLGLLPQGSLADLPDQERTDPTLRAQRQQRAPSTLDTLLHGLCEPALAHRDGRIAGLNAALVELLDHPAPDLLVGLPAKALLERLFPEAHGGVQLALLVGPEGSTPAGLRTLSLDLADGPATLWVFGPPPVPDTGRRLRALTSLEDTCERLWSDGGADTTDLLRSLGGVVELLQPPEEDTHVPRCDLVELVRSVTGDTPLHTPTGAVWTDVPAEDVLHLVAPILQELPPDTSIRVDVDVAAHPVIILRHALQPLLSGAHALRRAQVLAANLLGSAISLDAGLAFRIRLPRPTARPLELARLQDVTKSGRHATRSGA